MDSKRERQSNKGKVTDLTALMPFLKPYRLQIGLAGLFLVISTSGALAIPAAIGQVIDQGFMAENLANINRWFWLLFLAACVMAVGGGLRFYWVSWLGQRVVADIRKAVYGRILDLSPEFFATTRTGEVLSRLNTDTTLVETLVGSTVSFAIRNAVMLVASSIALAVTAPKLALVIAGLIVLMIVPVSLFGRWVRRLSRDAQDRIADISAVGDESINAIQTVQAFAQEDRERSRFGQIVEAAVAAARRRIGASTLMIVFVILMTFGVITFVLWLGARAVLTETMTPGQLGQFVLYAAIAAGSTASLSEIWTQIQRAAGATERLAELLSLQPTIVSPQAPLSLPQGPLSVRLKGVGFSYPSRPDEQVIEGLDLEIAPGQTVAIVGPSGAGKSTLLQLLLRFYDPSDGVIEMGGVPIGALELAQLRRAIGYVPQDVAVFSGSVDHNIRYGQPLADGDQVQRASAMAHAQEFIERWEAGFDTELGERGVRLSGGQRQRIAIARALIKAPQLLLLDEATASLDAQSEQLVQRALESISRNHTVIVIAHRLATVRRADRIVVMDEGKIVAQGRHEELLEANPLYANLARLQFLDGSDATAAQGIKAE
ncbi:MAG: ABC transporter transmembrane domain-containing protein [Wenzhouxiangella sp.]|nr:ABC transporter transmembrane domain-containing protein [Wenzhouxiangella sp.]MDR9453594.1 ABC transporter transmembrane domain-containing protein [Wenzhouxiangella sp.]